MQALAAANAAMQVKDGARQVQDALAKGDATGGMGISVSVGTSSSRSSPARRPISSSSFGKYVVASDGGELWIDSYTVAADAPRTLRRVVLSLASGTLAFSVPDGDQFLVAAPSPVLESVTPQVVVAGQAVTMQLRGRNFSDVQGVRFEPSAGLTAGAPFTTAAGGTQLTFQLRVAPAAASGERTVIVQSAGGESSTPALPGNSFRVATQAGPVRDSIAAPLVGVLRGAVTASPVTEARATYSSLVGVAFDGEGVIGILLQPLRLLARVLLQQLNHQQKFRLREE